jgi:hypothetical protein
MKTLHAVVLLCALVAPAVAAAQTKTLPGEMVTTTVTIEAIEQSTRTLTVVDEKGMHKQIYVPTEVKRFPELKIGDKITARYYDNVVVRLRKPGDKPVDSASVSTTPLAGGAPGGTIAKQRTITATITAIDQKVPSITVKGPNGWLYSTKVEDTKALATVKVGDQLDITWTEAMMIAVDPGK